MTAPTAGSYSDAPNAHLVRVSSAHDNTQLDTTTHHHIPTTTTPQASAIACRSTPLAETFAKSQAACQPTTRHINAASAAAAAKTLRKSIPETCHHINQNARGTRRPSFLGAHTSRRSHHVRGSSAAQRWRTRTGPGGGETTRVMTQVTRHGGFALACIALVLVPAAAATLAPCRIFCIFVFFFFFAALARRPAPRPRS